MGNNHGRRAAEFLYGGCSLACGLEMAGWLAGRLATIARQLGARPTYVRDGVHPPRNRASRKSSVRRWAMGLQKCCPPSKESPHGCPPSRCKNERPKPGLYLMPRNTNRRRLRGSRQGSLHPSYVAALPRKCAPYDAKQDHQIIGAAKPTTSNDQYRQSTSLDSEKRNETL